MATTHDDGVDDMSTGEQLDGSLTGEDEQQPKGAKPTTEEGGGSSGRKRRPRRKNKAGRHHKKWKPYNQLTEEEKLERDKTSERRANQRYEKQLKKGIAMAPYNTSSFIIAQHEKDRMEDDQTRLASLGSLDSPENGPSTEDVSEVIMQENFYEEYDMMRYTELMLVDKSSLVSRFIDLERRHEELENKYRQLRSPLKQGFRHSPVSRMMSSPVRSGSPHTKDNGCSRDEAGEDFVDKPIRRTQSDLQHVL